MGNINMIPDKGEPVPDIYHQGALLRPSNSREIFVVDVTNSSDMVMCRRHVTKYGIFMKHGWDLSKVVNANLLSDFHLLTLGPPLIS